MFMSGTHSGLTQDQADQLRQDLQDRADSENAKITFSQTGDGQNVTLSWTVVLPLPSAPKTDPAAPTPARTTELALAEQAFRFFTQIGWTAAQAAGLLGNIEAESNFKASAVGDSGTALGICQWHADRQAQFHGHFGHAMQTSSFEEQLQFVNFELRNGKETRAGDLLKAAASAAEAGRVVSTEYERPADIAGSATKRAALAEKWFNRFGNAPL